MTRNLKALGLALTAMFALSAVITSAASAQTNGKITSAGSVGVTLTGEETGAGKNFLRLFGTTIECPGSTQTGHRAFLGGQIPNGSSEVTLTPHYKQTEAFGTANCNAFNGTSVTIDMNGCDYVLRLGETTGGDTYAARTDIVCPIGKEISVTFFATHTHSSLLCVIHIGSQSGLWGADTTGTTNETIDITGTITGIKATKTNTGILCPEETTVIGSLGIDLTVKAHNEFGSPVAIGLSH